MNPLDRAQSALTDFAKAQPDPIKGRLLLQIVKMDDGTTTLATKFESEMSLWERIKSFFGASNFQLRKIIDFIRKNPSLLATDGIANKLNAKVQRYRQNFHLRKIPADVIAKIANKIVAPTSAARSSVKAFPETPGNPALEVVAAQIPKAGNSTDVIELSYDPQHLDERAQNIFEMILTSDITVSENLDGIFRAIDRLCDEAKQHQLPKLDALANILRKELQQRIDEAGTQADKTKVTAPQTAVYISNDLGLLKQIGDGNCLFRSFATALAKARPDSFMQFDEKRTQAADYHPEFRKQAVEYLRNHKDEFWIKAQIESAITEHNEAIEAQIQMILDSTAGLNKFCAPEELAAAQAHLDQELDDFAQRKFCKSGNEAIDEYLERAANLTYFGSNPELFALCQIYKIKCDVYILHGSDVLEKTVELFPMNGAPRSDSDTISLLYSGNHYDSLVPMSPSRS